MESSKPDGHLKIKTRQNNTIRALKVLRKQRNPKPRCQSQRDQPEAVTPHNLARTHHFLDRRNGAHALSAPTVMAAAPQGSRYTGS
jgi:hypothetical protein